MQEEVNIGPGDQELKRGTEVLGQVDRNLAKRRLAIVNIYTAHCAQKVYPLYREDKRAVKKGIMFERNDSRIGDFSTSKALQLS